jgi:ElaA protein
MSVAFRTMPFDALDARQLHDLLRLREDIFVVEQRCIYHEIDGLDPECLHVIGEDPEGALVACARIIPPHGGEPPHIGRVAVSIGHRGRGVARALMLHALESSARAHGTVHCALAAQAHLEGFYASLGFRKQGGPYLLDGIPHIDMRRP